MATNNNTPCARVELAISARKLPDMDFLSLSDPMVVLYKREFGQQSWVEYDRTEEIKDNLNPDFEHKFNLDYYFEEKQFLKFEVYDIDCSSDDLSKHDFIGEMETTLSHVVSCVRIEETLRDKKKKKDRGTIIVTAEKKNDGAKELLHLQFRGEDMEKKDTQIEIYKENDDGDFILTKRSDKGTSSKPKWKEFKISVAELCNGDWDRPLKFLVKSGSKDVGEFTTNLRNLSRGPAHASGTQNCYNVINEKKRDKKGYSNSGIVKLEAYSMESQYSFVDYIQGGCQIKVSVAVDFTSSNGESSLPSSLHYSAPGAGKNQYSRAIEAVVGVLEEYDSDKKIPAYGFGAKHPLTGGVMDIFALNHNKDDPECHKVAGVLEAYHKALHRVQLHGPTNFAPTIEKVACEAKEKVDGSEYHILLILTDGAISDMNETRKIIVAAAKLPLSIIIIGIGNEDFRAMDILDGDHVRLSYKKEQAVRDIVQFVAFKNFDPRNLSDESKGTMILAKEVLAEVPDQFMEFMRLHNLRPRRGSMLSRVSVPV